MKLAQSDVYWDQILEIEPDGEADVYDLTVDDRIDDALGFDHQPARSAGQVAAQFGSFPIILEAYREVLRDVFDVPALVETLRRVRDRSIRTVVADTEKPSPFAGSLLFRYVANFLYDGDAPLAERRAQALAIDQAQLRSLLGEPELRELLDEDTLAQVELELQHLDDRHKAKSVDAIHDLVAPHHWYLPDGH